MKELDFITIGSRIRERRTELKITQEHISNMLEVNPSHISNIENGRANPSLSALVKIANILECSVDFFLRDEYTFTDKDKNISSIDQQLANKLKMCDTEKKKKILKIIDII